jgi:hypothetical protein
VPSPIQTANYTETWNDEFDTFDTSRWNTVLRWGPCTPAAGRVFTQAGVLHLQQQNGDPCFMTQVNTGYKVTHPLGIAPPVYVEVRAKTAPGDNAWTAAWGLNFKHVNQAPAAGEASSACTLARGGELINEIDLIDNGAQAQQPDHWTQVIRKMTGLNTCGVLNEERGCGVPVPAPFCSHDMNVDLSADFHRYALWWTPGEVRFYFDDTLVEAVSTWPDQKNSAGAPMNGTDKAPMALLLKASRGYYGCNGCGADPALVDAQFDYVRVYEPSV